MDKFNKVLSSTCLAAATGLFTGGAVAMAISNGISKEILFLIYFPSFVLYVCYVALEAIDVGPKDWKRTALFVVILLIVVSFGSLKIFF